MPETIRRTSTPNRLSNTGFPTSRSIARFPTTLGVAETIIPPDSPEADHAKPTPKPAAVRQSRPSGSGWPAIGFDETTPTQAARSRADKSPISSFKKRETPSTTTGTQSKLAAFGFFGQKSKKPIKGFEEDWEMEDDLPFDNDLAPDAEESEERGQKSEDRRLQAVPLPPPHPSLRPAGLRELKRLEATRSTRPLVLNHDHEHDHEHEHEHDNEPEELFPDVQPSSSSSHTPTRHGGSSSASSVTTESELGMNSSAVAWWDGLEDRRSSEFGSVPRLS
jgi:hypothetical protein